MAERIPIREGTFRDAPDGGALLGNRCRSCRQVFFPKAKLCLACLHQELEEVVLSRTGTLYSYTIAHMPSSRFQPPCAMGFVDLPEGLRIFAPLKPAEGRAFEVGMEMEVVIGRLWEEGGKEVIGYMFQPAGR
ncbi:MAG: OB-fold domain-containing protein [bacterium]